MKRLRSSCSPVHATRGFLGALVSLLAIASSSGCGGGAKSSTPRLHTAGRELQDPAGHPVVLRGVNIADLHDVGLHRPPPYDVAKLLDLLSDGSQGWYARVVRLIVYPALWKADPDDYLEKHLKPAVAHAAARGLYAIVDWHEIADAASVDEETRAFWTRVAPLFANDDHVLYEVFNEPKDFGASWSAWRTIAQPWVDLIRRAAPRTVILIGGPTFDEQIVGAVAEPFVGDNLAYVAHIYASVSRFFWDPGGPFEQVAAVHPLVITEWGYSGATGLPGNDLSFGAPLKDFVERNRLSWTAFCADTEWSPTMFDETWTLRVGPGEMGGFTKDWLAEKRDDDQPGGPRAGARDAGGGGAGGAPATGGGGGHDADAGVLDGGVCGDLGQPCCVDGLCISSVCSGRLSGTCLPLPGTTPCDRATPCPTGQVCTAEKACFVDCTADPAICPVTLACAQIGPYCDEDGGTCDKGPLRACGAPIYIAR